MNHASSSPASLPHYQIHHYPTEWIDVWPCQSKHKGERLTLRPILPQDQSGLAQMVQAMSAKSRHERFHGGIKRLSAQWLAQMTELDYQHHMAFVVTHRRTSGEEEIVAEARYAVDSEDASDTQTAAEFALTVADDWQGCGIGLRAMCALLVAAHEQGLAWLHGEVLADNQAMLALMRRCQFICSPCVDDEQLISVERSLGLSPPLSWPSGTGPTKHETGRQSMRDAATWWTRWQPSSLMSIWGTR